MSFLPCVKGIGWSSCVSLRTGKSQQHCPHRFLNLLFAIAKRRVRNEGALNEGGKPELSPSPWRSAWTPHCYLCWWNTAIAPLTHLAPVALNTSNALTLLYRRNFDLLSSISERAVLVRAGDKLRASLASRSFFSLLGNVSKSGGWKRL